MADTWRDIDERKLLNNIHLAAIKVVDWCWDDCDQEPLADMNRLQAALDDLADFRRLEQILKS